MAKKRLKYPILSGLKFFFLLLSTLLFLGSDTLAKMSIDQQHIYQNAQQAITFLKNHQKSDGAIILERSSSFDVWETIQAARAISLWRNRIDLSKDPVIRSALVFLKRSETPEGMVLHTHDHKSSYDIEASSEYVRMLSFLERRNVVSFMDVLKKTSYLIK